MHYHLPELLKRKHYPIFVRKVNETRTKNLTPKKRKLYQTTVKQRYLIRKLITSTLLECEECIANLTVANWEPFTMLKEHDAKQRLNYANENSTLFLAQVYDIIYSALPVYGHVDNIMRKLKCTIVNHITYF
ncbi:hypothetical protein JTB14_034483 [Gonioctena quinquepunctata]|nr:hypothetical protein JTB14_034483 [Gonioctena quinquepunctata]